MEILVKRLEFSERATIGKLSINGEVICDTLEDTFRQLPESCPYTSKGEMCKCKEKVYGKTCIPYGRYKVNYRYSPKFGKHYPALENVPHFLGILIHAGSNVDHTEGCILVGERVPNREQLKNQFAVFTLVKNKVKEACEKGEEVWITIEK